MLLTLLFIALLQPAPTTDARAEAERLFRLGRALFDRGDAAGAVAAFEGAAATGWTAGALEYDWGTACLAIGDLGCAMLHLERAERLTPGHAAVAHNLRLARARVGPEAQAPSPSAVLLGALRRGPGVGALLGLGVVLYLGAAGLAGYKLWTRRTEARLQRALVVLVPLAVLVLGLGLWTWADERASEAVVVAAAALHDAPGERAGGGVDLGRVVRLLSRRGDWVEVRAGGARGWLPARFRTFPSMEPHVYTRDASGWIEVICGSMFSGKTEELIRRLRRARIARQRVEIFKPALDTRYGDAFGEAAVVSHDETAIPSQIIHTAEQMLLLAGDADVVGVDEAQFFDDRLVAVCQRLAGEGKRVVVAGLDQDYLGRPFEPVPALMAVAEHVTKLHAVCVVCGAPANHSQRIVASGDRVLVGEKDAYEPRCRRHFDPSSATPTPPEAPASSVRAPHPADTPAPVGE